MIITRQGFSQVVGNAFAGLGFAPEGPAIYEFPMDMFVPGSDLTPLAENIDKVVYGLTKWEPEIKELGVITPPKVTVEGKDYAEAYANANLLFLKNMWGDGLSLLPATEENVNWILTGTDLSPDTIVGEGNILPRGGVTTVESLAVCLAMAGGRPEYLPLLIAAVEAFTDPLGAHQSWNSTTQSVFPVFIVNGPIASQIRVGSGYGCLGPDPIHPAGGAIGRAIRLVLLTMGGAIPGIGTMALFGGMRYTNAVFAEDEAGLPPGWEPLSVDQGVPTFPKGSNVVSITCCSSVGNVGCGGNIEEEGILQDFHNLAHVMLGRYSPNRYLTNRWTPENPEVSGASGVVLIARGTAQGLANIGWSKLDLQTFLWENSKTPWSWIVETGQELRCINAGFEGQAIPVTLKPEQLMVVVAGGEQSMHSYFLTGGMTLNRILSVEIELPANWDELLEQAEEDLGPIPA